jgi:hypothetical protein
LTTPLADEFGGPSVTSSMSMLGGTNRFGTGSNSMFIDLWFLQLSQVAATVLTGNRIVLPHSGHFQTRLVSPSKRFPGPLIDPLL